MKAAVIKLHAENLKISDHLFVFLKRLTVVDVANMFVKI